MEKIQKNERIAALIRVISDSPGKIFTLGTFTEMFGSAKSTISEDLDVAANLLSKFELGTIETISGASGGVKFIPTLSRKRVSDILEKICFELSNKSRILPGGYLYMLDVIFDPAKVSDIACIFATHFSRKPLDYVITVETKGIPLAFMTAKLLNIPLIIVRHYSEATDGASVNINYVSGSSNKIQTMVLSIKALKRNSKLLFIDDFMKGGGTAKGIIELAKEFDSEVAGIGVLIETIEPKKKLIDNCYSLLTLNSVIEQKGYVDIKPRKDLLFDSSIL